MHRGKKIAYSGLYKYCECIYVPAHYESEHGLICIYNTHLYWCHLKSSFSPCPGWNVVVLAIVFLRLNIYTWILLPSHLLPTHCERHAHFSFVSSLFRNVKSFHPTECCQIHGRLHRDQNGVPISGNNTER
jgi:hypothetical protein